ncbi:MAG: nicotinate-nucleotide--dimethylbenzimidazole phosphoribosyltransferase [Lachnospiraceae bacterium]|nr:nicotinate-nucleotide--dimethylbenzimidazole phosphoribosyltransferase [Lachnospiraceae bacterium]
MMKKEELMQLHIQPPDENVRRQVKQSWDNLAKPLDSMGRFETLTAQIGAILEDADLDIGKKAVIVMCADNGIVEEGISQSGQEVTAAVARAMGQNQSSVCRMAQQIGADVIPVDIGINQKEPIPGVRLKKAACGTRNFAKEPAMTEAETLEAIATGMEMVKACKEAGYRLVATGEMGIGNTTTSSAVAAALLGCEAADIVGRGAGLSDSGLARKKQVIQEALERYRRPDEDAFMQEKQETLRILAAVGGLDIAGLAGVCIGGARYHLPVVLDGVISAVAALTASRLVPGVRDYLIPSHMSREPAMQQIMKELQLTPVIDGGLALGEGTGAVMMFALLDLAAALYRGRTTFSKMEVEPYERFC